MTIQDLHNEILPRLERLESKMDEQIEIKTAFRIHEAQQQRAIKRIWSGLIAMCTTVVLAIIKYIGK